MANRIKELRKQHDLTLAEVAKKIGVSESTMQRYESEKISKIKYETMEALANIFAVSPAYLMGWDDTNKIITKIETAMKGIKVSKVPILSNVPCGSPEVVYENIDPENYIEIDSTLADTKEYYGLMAKGDSMLPKIEEGDMLIVHFQRDVESGQVAIVRVNGEEATCKRVKKYRDGIELIGINPTFEPRFFTNEEIKSKPVEIIGRVIEVRSKL